MQEKSSDNSLSKFLQATKESFPNSQDKSMSPRKSPGKVENEKIDESQIADALAHLGRMPEILNKSFGKQPQNEMNN